MWKRKDWIQASVSAAAAFGMTAVVLDASLATADKPAIQQRDVAVPTLTLGQITVTADAAKDASVRNVTDAVTYVKDGPLPTIDVTFTNPSDQSLTVKVSAEVLTSRIPNPLSRVPMRATDPKSQYTHDIEVAIGPGETKVVPLSTNVNLASMSSASLVLSSGNNKVMALNLNNGPVPLTAMGQARPATMPSDFAINVPR